MNVPFQHAGASQHLMIVDCDIHPAYRTPADLHPFLPARWREHMTTFGEHLRQGLSGQLAWPRMMASGMRLDDHLADRESQPCAARRGFRRAGLARLRTDRQRVQRPHPGRRACDCG